MASQSTPSALIAFLTLLLRDHVAFGEVELILHRILPTDPLQDFEFDVPITLDLAGNLAEILALTDQKRRQARNNVPKIVDAAGEPA